MNLQEERENVKGSRKRTKRAQVHLCVLRHCTARHSGFLWHNQQKPGDIQPPRDGGERSFPAGQILLLLKKVRNALLLSNSKLQWYLQDWHAFIVCFQCNMCLQSSIPKNVISGRSIFWNFNDQRKKAKWPHIFRR